MTIQSGEHFLPARRALADDVYDAVLGLLMDQVIEPGSRASIDGIARQLNVSPTPVREALARLESEGLVVKKALKGYTAAPLLDSDGLRQLFEMRRLLEPYATRNAAGELDADTLKQLEDLCDAMHRSGQAAQTGGDRFKDYKDFANQDAEFHRIIAEHSGNALLADAIGRLRSHMHQYRIYFKHGVVDETSGEHEAVLEALRSGKPASAEKAMLDHITKSYARISASLAEAEKAG
ncbi:DNA-binding transcriptional regulator, GntR family [Leifsonia sp. 98AMF]|jgi:DNA-binding GntR family transcriptional regulator|uniref:GntR family transcriptional regulator n=1 Tax=Microbacteriaceae TaxID=85023 RepID=UPI000371AA94|nr:MULTISPECIES: GntR family transcriptional regulator [Microbacteriaceae]TDQ02505.1 DNA-binding GntR family transcriptional regulator [Leifsonia sp. 115AMFTsu3.1]SDH10740.1 DNA-binding transcriptional regulator, GntR family [Leifsonia sp. 197AMF]SDJ28182.1 DNA-binding transcriptional regulator, GntR family [Leifsonia sp. 466MF]SDK52700.1 DNA-binding transcriptional regulator, GntR family [Leifsonia sp. 157MF]SDN50163.1 DNA-binding transcriptional regulator, GntR family [Leifsonia sp. 509MF]